MNSIPSQTQKMTKCEKNGLEGILPEIESSRALDGCQQADAKMMTMTMIAVEIMGIFGPMQNLLVPTFLFENYYS